ncbi:MAG TPA: DUF6174 domain-containing protein [Anaerolineales bacterium]|nr:DUF6174 domain-containing protein [Anaerolineales bacterium]
MRHPKPSHLLFFSFSPLFLLILLSACSPASPLDNAERKWQEQEIVNYKIEVLTVNSIWHAQYQEITVENGVVTEQSARCVPAPFEMGECEVQDFVAEEFTVPGLFAHARAVSEETNPDFLTISFDPTYFYPQNISFNDPEIVDEDWGWSVTAFEVLEP